MNISVNPIPKGYSVLSPYLVVKGAARAIAFYTEVFGGKERMRLPGPGETIGHAELQFGDSVLMLADEMPGCPARAPSAAQPVSTPGLSLYVEKVDATFKRAVEAGAKVVRPIQDQFYGDRSGTIVDPFGYTWTLASHIDDVTPEEMTRRMGDMMKKKGQ